ncbi:MAG: glucokinase, partial [Rhodocyclaceae bacterium]|nr:glucokinase [Rhodocyclaceae bacterium]
MQLVGDIGGTRSRLAFSSPQGLLHVRVFANADFPDFATLLGQFLTETGVRPLGGCFAVAGPVA